MSTQLSFKNIQLSSINTTHPWSLHPFLDETPSPTLQQSFSEVGILHPPIVQQTQDGTFFLICGRKRLHALKHYFKQTNCTCIVIQATLTTSAFLLYILTDQQLNGPLSPIEIAHFLKYCLDKMDKNEVINFFLPRLGYKKQEFLINQLVSLLTLEETIQCQIHHGLIIDKIAFELLPLPPKDRLCISSLFELLQPGTGKQKRILTLSQDIANRSQKSISSLFEEQDFKNIIEHQVMNLPQKTHALLELLQRELHPRSSDAERIFKDRVRKLNLPDNFELTHSCNFEKNEVCLSQTFPDLKSCETAWMQKMNYERR
jgi:hypothetical protein